MPNKKESEVIKLHKDLEQRYFIFIDKRTLSNIYYELLELQAINRKMDYEYKLNVIAEFIMHLLQKYKRRYA